MKKGIDVSRWQGNVDFNKVKKVGYDFVIINAGYGRYINQKDPYFEQNYKNAKAAGLGVGAYWYSYATNASEAKQEAQVFLQAIAGKQFDYPVVYDIEDDKQRGLSNSVIGGMIDAFCGHLEANGYYACLYSYADFLNNKVPAQCKQKYDVWVAAFNINKPPYNGTYGMWQYTSTGGVSGVNGNCDCNYAYKDYPSIIKNAGLNKFPKPVTKTEPKKTETKTEPKVEEKKPETTNTEEVFGDLNGDGKVNVTDLVKLAAHVKGKKMLKKPKK